MASMNNNSNNWLAFSLSPQELPSSSHSHHSPSAAAAAAAVSHLISGDDVSHSCYGLSAAEPPMGIPTASFGILEAFHRPHHIHTADWNMKSLDFKGAGSSELSMLVGSSSNNTHNSTSNMQEDEPKLEDFLGGHSFSDHHHKLLPDEYMPFHMHDGALINTASLSGGASSSHNNTIGLSMIKTWLRNQPTSQQQQLVTPPNNNIDMTAEASSQAAANCGGAMVVANVIGPYGNSQSLSLSMSTGSQSSPGLPALAAGGESSCSDNKQKGVGGGALDAQTGAIEAASRKPVDTFGQRTSIYRGVTRHRWTGRYEAHLWDNSCRREGQTRKGRQVYLGGYDKEDKAARAYDLAALKYWGPTTTTNFPISNYEKELEEMKHMTRQEFVASLRRKSSGFSRGASIYRGVTRHHQHGRWQARIGRVAGNKDLYLGTFSTQEEAAEAYDIAAIKFRGLNAVTNFDMSRYDVKSILESNTLPIGSAAKRLKDVADHADASVNGRRTDVDMEHLATHFDGYSSASYAAAAAAAASLHLHHQHQSWPTIAFHQQPHPLTVQYPQAAPYGEPRGGWCKQEQQDPVAAHSLHDIHQLQLGAAGHNGGTHNFFQPSSVLHNLVNIDSSAAALEHSTGSNSVALYNSGNVAGGGGYQGGYAMPVVGDQSHNAAMGYDAYYLSQQLAAADAKGSGYEQSSAANWMPAAGQSMASRSGHGTLYHGME